MEPQSRALEARTVKTTRCHRVLIVEDEPSIRLVVQNGTRDARSPAGDG